MVVIALAVVTLPGTYCVTHFGIFNFVQLL